MFDLNLETLILAQEGAAGLPGDTTSAPGAAPGLPPAGTSGGTGFPPSIWLILFGFLVLMLVMSFGSQRREKKKRAAMLNAVKKHDKVQTVGGVIGAIVEIKPDYVVLKVDESSNTRITFARSSIQQVLASSEKGN